MNQRDLELLDKELWGVSPNPPRSGNPIIVALLAIFLAGVAVGGVLFTREPIQTASHDALAAISLSNGVPSIRE